MTNWMLRGLVFGGAMVVVRLFQGTLISVLQTQATLISLVLMALFLVGVVVWGLIDGREDASSNPDPDRREDLAMTWLLAGLVAGLLSGAVTWLIAVFYKALYVGGLVNELTTFAAFTALVVFLGAISGVAVGRWRIDRSGNYKPKSGSSSGGDEDRADTDVFAAVRSDQAGSDGTAVAEWPQEQSTAVATAERGEYDAPTAYSHEADATAEAPAAHRTEKTETLPAHEPVTEQIEKPKTD
ncbi:B-4DMT family transporter [Mycobacterium sp.]|uniref:B-4DMT family transporter n=1 Tax=Mycobacterium sp. TaxID=1785 RepID=UPI0025CCC551|nr:B-4DMT family transporter [Mycobacterium sp.]